MPLRGTLEPKQPGKISFVGQHDLFFAWVVVDYLLFVLVFIILYTLILRIQTCGMIPGQGLHAMINFM